MRAMVLYAGIVGFLINSVCAGEATTSTLSLSQPEISTSATDARVESAVVFAAAAPSHTQSDEDVASTSTPSAEGSNAATQKAAEKDPPRDTSSGPSPSVHRPHAASAERSSTSSTHRIPHPSPFPSPEIPAHVPIPPPPHPPPPGPDPHPWSHQDNQSHSTSPVAIAFEVLGGIVGLFILYLTGRCFYSWRKTPHRDRIETVLNRHYLDREMEEREREDIERRLMHLRQMTGSPTRMVPPPPPYIHAPSYEDTVDSPTPPLSHPDHPSEHPSDRV